MNYFFIILFSALICFVNGCPSKIADPQANLQPTPGGIKNLHLIVVKTYMIMALKNTIYCQDFFYLYIDTRQHLRFFQLLAHQMGG